MTVLVRTQKIFVLGRVNTFVKRDMISKRQVQADSHFMIGLSWDEVKGKEIDLDLQCVLLNDLGQIEDAVYYNQLKSAISDISLSEDSKGEKEGFDEILTISLKQMAFGIKYLAILVCSYKGEPFSSAESANVQILQNEVPFATSSVGGQGNNLSFLPFIFERNFDGTWVLVETSNAGQGKTFVECEDVIKKGLISCGFDEGLLQECKNWTGGKSFQLSKEDNLIIPSSLKEVQVGLGWDTRCDIDSSILLYDIKGQILENIYFGNKKSFNGSVVHHGDNLTGEGSGDDEKITIYLDKIDERVKCIWAVITIYTSGMQFDDVSGAYCRLIDPKSKKEFCKFNLSKNKDGVSTGNIMCCLTRHRDNVWAISPKGFYVKNTKTSFNVVPIITEVISGNYSNIKILEDKSKVKATHQISIIKAKGLASFDSNGFSDPYVILKVNDKDAGRTKTIMKNLNPEWNETFNVTLKNNDKIEFRMFDYDRFLFDDFMGTCKYNVTEEVYQSYTKQEMTFLLQDKNFIQSPKFTGEITVAFRRVN